MNQSLLVADGDAELCNLYKEVLTEQGYDVTTASDGLDCLNKLRRSLPAALVLDLELRWGGGDGVLAWLREERPTHVVPIITTATVGYARKLPKGDLPLVVDHLAKPFRLPALMEKIWSAVNKTNRVEPSNQKCDSSPVHSGELSMKTQSTNQLILPAFKPDDEPEVVQTTASLLTQSLEDLCLATEIEQNLRSTGYKPLREVEVSVSAGIVYLVGRVPSYHLKQIAQVTIKSLPGIHRIHNGLQVVRPN
jgi:CheY-like chemotaxis protein